jgi:hypothetical protein
MYFRTKKLQRTTKTSLRQSAPKKVKVCVEMQQLTLSLFSCAVGCCLLARGTITAAIMAVVVRVDVGLLVLAASVLATAGSIDVDVEGRGGLCGTLRAKGRIDVRIKLPF